MAVEVVAIPVAVPLAELKRSATVIRIPTNVPVANDAAAPRASVSGKL